MTRMSMLLAIALLAPAAGVAQQTAAPPAAQAGHSYDAAGRRDPFVSLMRRGVESTATPSSRASGLAGLAAADVSLRGVLTSNSEFVGIVQGADNKTYIVRAGQRLADGTIRRIERDAMVIVQQITDPLAAERQRELRKALRQDEAR